MGACNFYQTIEARNGETMEKAFARAHEEAAWEHGHGGYTGTLAEKHGYVAVDLPKGKSAMWLDGAINEYLNIGWGIDVQWTGDRVAYEQACKEATVVTERKQDTETELAKVFGARKAREIVEVWDDKWGPAIACKDGKNFVFMGMASS